MHDDELHRRWQVASLTEPPHQIMGVYELDVPGGKILYVDGTAEYRQLEHWGIHLINKVSARLRAALTHEHTNEVILGTTGTLIPEGPHFVYEIGPSIFLRRRGRGPLFVAWDTNLLIDYFQFGSALWEGDGLPGSISKDYAAELEGLQLLLALWVIRDIRFIIFPDSIEDAKKQLSPERRGNRVRAFDEFTSALRLVGWDDPDTDAPSRDGLLILPESELHRALAEVPAGFDRKLVEAGVRSGTHVFLTRDDGILRAKDALRPFGLLVATPLDVLEGLVGCGAFHCLLELRYAYWPLPDQQRVGHLIRALSPSPP